MRLTRVPVLMTQIKTMGESDLRTELNELVIDILTRSNDRAYRTEMNDWAKGIGLTYVPSSMRHLVHYKMPSLLESGYYGQIEKAARVQGCHWITRRSLWIATERSRLCYGSL